MNFLQTNKFTSKEIEEIRLIVESIRLTNRTIQIENVKEIAIKLIQTNPDLSKKVLETPETVLIGMLTVYSVGIRAMMYNQEYKVEFKKSGKGQKLIGEFPLTKLKGCFIYRVTSHGDNLKDLEFNCNIVVVDKESGYSEIDFDNLSREDKTRILTEFKEALK